MRHHVRAILLGAAIFSACGDGDSTGPTGELPVLTQASPSTGTVGTEIRIDGSGFPANGLPEVFFNNTAAPVVTLEGGALFATAPAGLTAGTTYAIRVVNPGGKADTLAAAFQATAPMTLRINGVTKPTGLRGMTVVVEGSAFSDNLRMSGAKVFFSGSGTTRIEAVIADSANDWTDRFVVTTVPQEVPDSTWVWVETPTGVSDSIQFKIIQSGVFSPSLINWTTSAPLPRALQGLGAVFVPVETGTQRANYVFAVGGADSANIATRSVYRAALHASGAVAAQWAAADSLPQKRAYGAVTAATVYTAAIDSLLGGGYLFMIGGVDSAGASTATVYSARVNLNGQLQPWQTTTALPVPLHGAAATVFRGYIYLTGGVSTNGVALNSAYRAAVNADGTVGSWETLPAMGTPRSFHALTSFGPYLYAVGGETTTTEPVRTTVTGTETSSVETARVNLRNGSLPSAGWTATSAMSKGRSKHSVVFAGGALLVTSGVYSGQPGSSENTYATVNSDGTLGAWQGATGAETITAAIGHSLYNQAAVTFIDHAGVGHILVIGGANRLAQGQPSSAVIFY